MAGKDCSGGRDKLRPLWPIPARPARCPAPELCGSAPGYPRTRQSRRKNSSNKIIPARRPWPNLAPRPHQGEDAYELRVRTGLKIGGACDGAHVASASGHFDPIRQVGPGFSRVAAGKVQSGRMAGRGSKVHVALPKGRGAPEPVLVQTNPSPRRRHKPKTPVMNGEAGFAHYKKSDEACFAVHRPPPIPRGVLAVGRFSAPQKPPHPSPLPRGARESGRGFPDAAVHLRRSNEKNPRPAGERVPGRAVRGPSSAPPNLNTPFSNGSASLRFIAVKADENSASNTRWEKSKWLSVKQQ
jgi:hypothetical protein